MATTGPQGPGPTLPPNDGLAGLLRQVTRAANELVRMSKSVDRTSNQFNKFVKSITDHVKALDGSTDAIDDEVSARKDSTGVIKQAIQTQEAFEKARKREAEDAKKREQDKIRDDLLASTKYKQIRQEAIRNEQQQNIVRTSLSKSEQRLRAASAELLQANARGDETAAAAKAKIVTKEGEKHAALQRQLTGLVTTGKQFQDVMDKHTDVVGAVTKKWKDFAAGFAFGTTTKQLYSEAQQAKVSGNYQDTSGFLKGQWDALMNVGVGSQVYNEILANTRTAQLTTSSIDEFNAHLASTTGIMQQFAASREDAAKMSGQLYQAGANVGITVSTMDTTIGGLEKTFQQLQKTTGKAGTELVEAMTSDADHRRMMLGLGGQERADYLKRRALELQSMTLKGYDIEQAKDLQKIAIQNRERSLAQEIQENAKARQSINIMAAASQATNPAIAASLRAKDAAIARLEQASKNSLRSWCRTTTY